MASTDREVHELLQELESESLGESELELGGLLGESEGSFEDESEAEQELVHEFLGESPESSFESSHEALGEGLGEGLGESLGEGLGEGLGESLGEGSFEDELPELAGLGESELEGQYFFGGLKRLARGVGGFVRRAAPILKSIAKVAAPMVATAVGGPLGGIIGKVATQALGEEELQALGESEGEGESEAELELEVGETPPSNEHEVQAEMMAAVAAGSQSHLEADGMLGAATVTTLSPADRRALRSVLPHMIRGTVILGRVLRGRRETRPAVRTVPTIVRRTARSLTRRIQAGRPVSRGIAARTMAAHTRRVLAQPRTCGLAIHRNVRVSGRASTGPRRRFAAR